MNYILLYNQLINQKINLIIKNSSKNIDSKNNYKCPFCKYKSNIIYTYKTDKNFSITKTDKNFSITQTDIHIFEKHDKINYNVYEKICLLKVKLFDIDFQLIHSNNFDIMEGLYNQGSKKIFLEYDKNLFNNKIYRYSEQYGFITFKNSKVDKITSLNKFRTASNDPEIFLPQNDVENLSFQYLYHTHPVTPYVGSRAKDGNIYEFPSMGDIIHFVDHHNFGKLLVSLIIAPEGLYTIRKNNFNKNKIKINLDLFIDNLEDIYRECFEDIYQKYKNNITSLHNISKINEEYFYKYIASNLEFIKRINSFLINHDLTIDFYARCKFTDQNNIQHWLLPNVFIPCL